MVALNWTPKDKPACASMSGSTSSELTYGKARRTPAVMGHPTPP